MIRSRLAASIAFSLAFVINPAYLGCGPTVEEPNFGEAEMLQCLDAANEIGTWAFTADGVDYEVELSLMQTAGVDVIAWQSDEPYFARVAHACGSRTFMQSASACTTTTQLVVEGELTLRRIDSTGALEILSSEPVAGDLHSYTTTLAWVGLSLTFGGGSQSLSLSAVDARTFELDDFNATAVGTPAGDIHYSK